MHARLHWQREMTWMHRFSGEKKKYSKRENIKKLLEKINGHNFISYLKVIGIYPKI